MIDIQHQKPAKTVSVQISSETNEDLVRSAKCGGRSKSQEIVLRLKHHLILFPDLPKEALPESY